MSGAALVALQRELTRTAEEMRQEARETTDALLGRRLNFYAGRLLGLVDAASVTYLAGQAPSD